MIPVKNTLASMVRISADLNFPMYSNAFRKKIIKDYTNDE